MRVAIDLTDEQLNQLRQQASELGIPAEELARAAVVDLVSKPTEAFAVVAQRVLAKNRELYRRLS